MTLLDLANRQLGWAQDNLYRARTTAKYIDPTKQYGESGKTLNQIISEYEEDEREARKLIAEATRV